MDESWTEALARAQAEDAYAEGRWPSCEGAVHAAYATALVRFHPFWSMLRLCFSTEPIPGGEIVPVSIGCVGGPPQYLTWWGHPYEWPAEKALLTESATEAAEMAALLAAVWADQREASGS
ncbi:hypothetical protein AB0M47_42470 [Hamadaea sp. NPDC051192]|uniref:hypothetical protein n=1 Tax=Hamadaea sp. NPDC051192 TaxID=3154940 RepID=UPI00344AC311